MKIRSGFVSNSSSSSFVVVGFEIDDNIFTEKDYLIKLFGLKESEIPEDELDFENLFCDKTYSNPDCYIATHDESGASEGKHLIGVLVAEADRETGDFNDCSFDMNELTKRANELKQKLGINNVKISLKIGVRCC